MFRSLSPVPQEGQAGGWLTYPGAKTGLLNVTAWQREAEAAIAAIAAALRRREPLALLLADVDHFKDVNGRRCQPAAMSPPLWLWWCRGRGSPRRGLR